MNIQLTEKVQGKTYNLFGDQNNSDHYFEWIDSIADHYLKSVESPIELHTDIRLLSKKRKRTFKGEGFSRTSLNRTDFINDLYSKLHVYTQATESHLKKLPFWKFRDKRLRTSEQQYHLYMLEIELTNRINIDSFLRSDYKIALLPHCLKDQSKKCKSIKEGFDEVCKGCSMNCYIEVASEILRKNDIHPYIWTRTNFNMLGKQLKSKNKTLGILGIACIPEVMAGLRKCSTYNIPAVGLPLNANRCARWFGEIRPTSVNLRRLENLLKNNQ